jgi:hypothetical protein
MNVNFKTRILREIEIARSILQIGPDLRIKSLPTKDRLLDFLTALDEEVWPGTLKPHLVPKPDSSELRGFFWGVANPNRLANIVGRTTLLFDKLTVLDPLAQFIQARGPDGPHERPAQWIPEIVRRAIYLCWLEDFVRNDLIIVFPAPGSLDFNTKLNYGRAWERQYGETFFDRFKSFAGDYAEEFLESHAQDKSKDEFLQFVRIIRVPPEVLPDAEAFYDRVANENPIRFIASEVDPSLKALEDDSGNPSQVFGHGTICNFLEARDIGTAVNAVLFSDQRRMWSKLLMSPGESPNGVERELQELAVAVQSLEFTFLNAVPPELIIQARATNHLSGLRLVLRTAWREIPAAKNEDELLLKAKEFTDRLQQEYGKYKEEMESLKTELRRDFANATVGDPKRLTVAAGASAGVAFLSGTIDWRTFLMGFACLLSASLKPVSIWQKNKTLLQHNPLFLLYSMEKGRK